MTHNPKIIGLALLGGITPSLVWLWFWLKEDAHKNEPKGLLTLCFAIGMLSVFFVLPIQQFIAIHVSSNNWQIILWASAEELIKFFAVMSLLYKTRYTAEPIDWAIYFITTALGFAAMENTLFLLKPLSLDQTTITLITGHMRFLGSTLLHTISTGIIGISMGLSYFMEGTKKHLYIFFALIVAVALHSVFNFFIMKDNGSDFLQVFSFLWVVTIIIMLLFEKLRRMSGEN